MPVYEYECPRCGTFEVEQKISDPPLTRCIFNRAADGKPTGQEFRIHGGVWCGEEVKRLIAGSTRFVLKGTGWFKDGY